MGEPIVDGRDGLIRALARVVEPFHAITYYSREMSDLTAEGYRGWWHAYFGYRPAPMGAVSAATVTAAFYNFAPRMVSRAVPGVWEIRSPEATTALRLARVTEAMARIFPPSSPLVDPAAVAEAAAIIRPVGDAAAAGHPVFAGYAELDWPEDDLVALWHGCTVLREFRGDAHNLALASSEVDGVESHVLMAGRGHGNQRTITNIRGWTDDEWAAAVERLAQRGWVNGGGSLTERGANARSEIEDLTDRFTAEPVRLMGEEETSRLIAILGPLVDHLAGRIDEIESSYLAGPATSSR